MQTIEKYYRKTNIPSGDLRISITNACNMNCKYCHNEGQAMGNSFLGCNDILYLVTNSLRYGINKVRITGGEPLVHPEIEEICRSLSENLKITNLGLNTNAYDSELLIYLCKLGWFKQVVVGIDYFDAPISKKSTIGPSSDQVKTTVQILKNMGINVQIAMVYSDGDLDNVIQMVDWCLDNQILLKILETTDVGKCQTQSNYEFMRDRIIKMFNLKVGVTVDLNELYAFNEKGRILFFHSHCNIGECHVCPRLHMRITHEGYAVPCIMRTDTRFDLMADFDDSMKKAIANLGVGPGMISF